VSVVTMTIHKHKCTTCNGQFLRRRFPAGPEVDYCACSAVNAERIELCDPCRKSIGEAGFMGDLVARMLERLIALEQQLAAGKAPAAQEVPNAS